MPPYNEFEKAVKIALIEKRQTQKWLCDEVSKKTGMFVDGSYMNRILSGKRNPQKIINAIKEILKLG